MSAAEHASPQPSYVLNKGEPAPVIDLDRRRRGAPPAGRGRRAAMETPSEKPRGDGEASRALSEWAESIERSFLEVRQSLTSPETATAYLRTLDVLERTLQGAHANDVIDDAQLAELTGLLAGLRQVPGLI